MNLITILIWVTIFIIGAIAIIGVKLHYKGDQLEHEEGSILPSGESIGKAVNFGKDLIATKEENKKSTKSTPRSLSPNTSKQDTNHNLFRRNSETKSKDDNYIVPESESNDLNNFTYKSENQVLINYDNTVEKFQEPIKQNQMDIMTQNNDKDTSELKDLFTIDELIKESKRKDSEREKESQNIKSDVEDPELEEIKESIKNKTQEPLIEEVIAEDKQSTITDLIKDEEKPEESETPSLASQKDIDEAIDTASKESEKEVERITPENSITRTAFKNDVISEPSLKTPNKVEETKDYKLGASIDDANLFGDDTEEEGMDLDYRKDLDKVKNKITGSKLFQDVKDRLTPETIEPQEEAPQEDFIRNVNQYEEYDEYEPIYNETYMDIEGTYDDYHDERIRAENTRRILKGRTPEPEVAQPKISEIKNKPERENIKVSISNGDFVLKKGDEIIFTHDGETYSSQVYAIKGDDISVKYRGKKIDIKPSDIKKIY